MDDDDPEQFLEERIWVLTEEQSLALQEHMRKFRDDPEYRKMYWKEALDRNAHKYKED
jgi:hypothetical protein